MEQALSVNGTYGRVGVSAYGRIGVSAGLHETALYSSWLGLSHP